MLYDNIPEAGVGQHVYSLEAVAKYLRSLGNTAVLTDAGLIEARKASKLVIAGAVREIVAGTTTIKIAGDKAISSRPIPVPSFDKAELTYSQKEIERVKIADLMSYVDTTVDWYRVSRKPLETVVKALEVLEREKKRGNPLYKHLKSAMRNLLDIVADAISAREGNDPSSLTQNLRKYSRSGEFAEVTDHVKHRLHITRTLMRTLSGNLRPVYKAYAETGRHYILVLDRSGSMSERHGASTKKAIASLIALLIARADPEARFTLILFDSEPKLVAIEKTIDEVVDEIVETEPRGGTSYPSALTAAAKILKEGDILVVIGDYQDGTPIPAKTSEDIKQKASKTILVPVGRADHQYAKYIAKQTGGELYIYKNGKLIKQ